MYPDTSTQGYEAYEQGLPRQNNPYPADTDAHFLWDEGWNLAEFDHNGPPF